MVKPYVEVASALSFPEGPVVLDDGQVVICELFSSRLRTFGKAGSTAETYTRGSPNGATLGSDGALYVAQHGGFDPFVSEKATPGIQRIRPGGGVEDLSIDTEGREIGGPNDICFGPDGRLYFTDPGQVYDAQGRLGTSRIWAVDPSMSAELIIDLGPVYCNGLGFLPDGRLVWDETYDRQIAVLEDGTRRVIAQLPDGHMPDGFAVAEDGRLFIASLGSHNITVLGPSGELERLIHLGSDVSATNCAFEGATLWVTDAGDFTRYPAGQGVGRLLQVETDAVGHNLERGALA